MLQWARANGCPWSAQTCEGAAQGGHLEVLQWAYANGCPWDADTFRMAEDCEHLEILHWLCARTGVQPID